jgi:hypothetical protein
MNGWKVVFAGLVLGFACFVCACATYILTHVRLEVPQCSACQTQFNAPSSQPQEDVPLIDQLGPENHFPATIKGPAIAEIWDGAQYCALVEVHEGETLRWNHPGAYWVAASEDALIKRFPAHTREYDKNYPNCLVLRSAYDVSK